MESQNCIVVFLIIFFNPSLISPITGYYILKRIFDEPPIQVTRQLNPFYNFNPHPRVRRDSFNGEFVNNIGPLVSGGSSTDEIIYSDEIINLPPEQSEYIEVNENEEVPLENNHLLIRRSAFPQGYDVCPGIPSGNYTPITCSAPGNFPINNTECILYHHCSQGKNVSQKRCCYYDRHFDHVLKVCKPKNEARCPANPTIMLPAEDSDEDTNRLLRQTVVSSDSWNSAEFGGPAGVGDAMPDNNMFDMPFFGMTQLGESKDGSATKTSGKNSKGGGGGEGNPMANFFDGHDFGGGGASSPVPSGKESKSEGVNPMASIFDSNDFGGAAASPPVPSGKESKGQGGDGGGNPMASFFDSNDFGFGASSPSSQNADSGAKNAHAGDIFANLFDSMPVFGGGGGGGGVKKKEGGGGGGTVKKKSKSGKTKNSEAAKSKNSDAVKTKTSEGPNSEAPKSPFDADSMASSFDMLNFGGGGGGGGGGESHSHMDHHIDHSGDIIMDRYGREHKHDGSPMPVHQVDFSRVNPWADRHQQGNSQFGNYGGPNRGYSPVGSNFGNYGGGGGGGSPNGGYPQMGGTFLGLDNLIPLLSNLQKSTIPGPFWFHNTKSGNMRPATFSYSTPVIIPIIISMPPPQMDMDMNPGSPNSQFGNLNHGDSNGFGGLNRQQNNGLGNSYKSVALKGTLSRGNGSPRTPFQAYHSFSHADNPKPRTGLLIKGAPRSYPNKPVTLDLPFTDDSPPPSLETTTPAPPSLEDPQQSTPRERRMLMQGRTLAMAPPSEEESGESHLEESTTPHDIISAPSEHPSDSKNCTEVKKVRKSKKRKGKKRSNKPEGLQVNVTMDDTSGNETTTTQDASEEDDGEDEKLFGENLENSTARSVASSSSTLPSTTTTTSTVPTTVTIKTSTSKVPPVIDGVTTTTISSLVLANATAAAEEDGSDWDFDDSVEVDDIEESYVTTSTAAPTTTTTEGKETVVLTGVTNRHGQIVRIKPVKRRDKIKPN